EQTWFPNREELEKYLEEQKAKRGGEDLEVADEIVEGVDSDSENEESETEEVKLQILDLHEVRDINKAMTKLKDFGIEIKDLQSAGTRNGEPYHPFGVRSDDNTIPLSSLRDLPPTLRKMGEKGLKLTRFKGLGEMNPDELFETSMDPENRVLLQVTMDDAAAADEIFRVLMGDQVEPRRQFIEQHALEVKDLDV
ncbi:MAG: DNA gyrase subunit B, partial [Planctomycetaceae bacterium]